MRGFYLQRNMGFLCFFFSVGLFAQISTIEEEKELQFQHYFFEALKQKAIKNYTNAIKNLELCEDIKSNNKAVAFEFSKNYFHLEKYFEAELFIEKALKNDPGNIHLLKHKVLLLKAQRKFEEAITVQSKIVAIKPRTAIDLVLLYIQNKTFDKAEKLITEMEENALSSSKLNAFKKYLQNVKNPAKEVEENDDTIANETSLEELKTKFDNDNSFKNLQNLLTKAQETQSYELLLEASNKGLELYPAQPSMYIYNAKALNKLTKYNDAIIVLSIGIDFVMDENSLLLEFYEQFVIAYQGLNNTNQVQKYKQMIKNLNSKSE